MARFYYGGQAVVEGVMMRGRHQATVCVRRPDGDIVSRTEELPAALYARRIVQLPFLRGLVMLWEMLILGMRMMLFSANVRAKVDLHAEIPKSLVRITLGFSLAFAVAIFFVLPLLLARAGSHVLDGTLQSNALEGVVRLGLFVGYLGLIGRMDQMGRVFQYHGAEHKTINAFEQGAELTPRTVQHFSLVHVRCGTAFLLWVVVISIFVFALLGHPPLIVGVMARIVLIPLIAAVSYEILRFGARFYHLRAVRAILRPGLWLQRLTTREPSEDQIEVAIFALLAVLRADGVLSPGGSSFVSAPHFESSVATT